MRKDEHFEQIRECILHYRVQYGYRPSIREVAEWLDLKSPGYVHKLMEECPGISRTKQGRGANGVRWELDVKTLDKEREHED